MTQNEVLKKLRYTFDYSDDEMISIFKDGDKKVNRSEVSNWLKKDMDPNYEEMNDQELSHFLNGFIIKHRGRRDGPAPIAEKTMTNNVILRKIKIALSLRDDDMVAILENAGFNAGKHEINALFRKPGQRQYRECMNQFLRNFMVGLQHTYRNDE